MLQQICGLLQRRQNLRMFKPQHGCPGKRFSASLVLAERQPHQSFSPHRAAYIHQKGINSRILLASEKLWQAVEA